MSAKLVTGGILAVLGLFFLKFMIGLLGLAMFFMVKIVPILLIGMVVVWIFRRMTRNGSTSTTTA